MRFTPPLGDGELSPRFIAISSYEYQAIAFENKDVYQFFYRFVPNHMIGYSILVYDLEAPIPRTKAPLPLRIRRLFKNLGPIDSCP